MTAAAAFLYLFIQTLVGRTDISLGGYCAFDCAQGSKENYSNYHSLMDYEYAFPHLTSVNAYFIFIFYFWSG